jgi:hypothetical protein
MENIHNFCVFYNSRKKMPQNRGPVPRSFYNLAQAVRLPARPSAAGRVSFYSIGATEPEVFLSEAIAAGCGLLKNSVCMLDSPIFHVRPRELPRPAPTQPATPSFWWSNAFFCARMSRARWNQGCQMVYFQTKNTNLGKFWSDLQ